MCQCWSWLYQHILYGYSYRWARQVTQLDRLGNIKSTKWFSYTMLKKKKKHCNYDKSYDKLVEGPSHEPYQRHNQGVYWVQSFAAISGRFSWSFLVDRVSCRGCHCKGICLWQGLREGDWFRSSVRDASIDESLHSLRGRGAQRTQVKDERQTNRMMQKIKRSRASERTEGHCAMCMWLLCSFAKGSGPISRGRLKATH